ncbi:MAG: CDP-diacylglycerol--serine O-phosphatidyltransferase [Bacteroidota bacterium]|nr:CDP-diacylglycerol--serine O-phosphatidyltransferase [Bacteroidota bacterium]
MSIINAAKGDFTDACLFIIYASLFDAVDGLAARLTNSSSEFGVELDSLSDVISFGAAPSFLLFSIYMNELGDIGIVLSSLTMVFAALRLARFNVQLVGFDKDKFNGLPAPMTSITICTYILFYHNKILSEQVSQIVIVILSVALPLLMVSRIKYESLPKPSLYSIKKNPLVFIILFIAIILTIATNGEGSFSFCLFYIFTGIVRSTKNLIFRKRKIVEDEIGDTSIELKELK